MLPLSRPIPKHSRSFTDTEQLGLQMTPRGRSNRTGITALAIILATGFILFQLGLGPDSRTYNRLHGTGSKKGRFGLEDVIQQVTVELAQTAEAYDTAKAHNDMGLNLGNLSLSAYTTHLRDTYDQFFSSRTTAPLDKVLANFGFLPPPSPSLPQNVYTTDSSIPEFPPQFKSWASVNPDWQTVFVDDEEIDAWADRAIPGSAGIKEEMRVLKETRGVLRADLFRLATCPIPLYMKLILQISCTSIERRRVYRYRHSLRSTHIHLGPKPRSICLNPTSHRPAPPRPSICSIHLTFW